MNDQQMMNTLLEPPTAKPAVAPALIPAKPAPRILVVEDDESVRQLNAHVLLRSGYQVDAAEDGAAGWEAVQAKKFDLLITDQEMPGLTGLELVKKVRSARMTLPIILVTASLPEEAWERHPWLRLAATLLKPFSPDDLVATVRHALHPDGQPRLSRQSTFSLFADTFWEGLPYPPMGLND